MAYQVPSQETRDADFRKQLSIIRNISLFQNAGINVDYSGQGMGSRDTPTTVNRGTTALDPVIHTVTKDISNLYHTTIQTGTVIVQDVTQGAHIFLHYVDQLGASIVSSVTNGIKGMWAFIKGVPGKVLTLVKALDLTGNTGNFYLDQDLTLNENQQVIIQWDPTLGTKGMWTAAGGTPSLASGAFANQQLSNLVGPTAINANLISDINVARDLGSVSKYWNNLYINTIWFPSSGGVALINTNGAGTVMNFGLNGINNLFTMSVTSQAGIFQALSSNSATPPSLKMFQTASPIANQVLGTINYDGFVGINQKSYVILSGQVASNGTSGKWVVQELISPFGTPQNMFSIDASTGLITCIGTKFVVDSNFGGIPDNPLSIDTLAGGGYASYSCKGGHLMQNDTGSKFYFGASAPNVFYQGIEMVVTAKANQSYTVDSTNGAGSDLIITMLDNSFTRNCTLPDANTFPGRFLIVKNLGTKAIFFVTVGGQTVDGQASGVYSLATQYASAILFTSGGQWFVAGKV